MATIATLAATTVEILLPYLITVGETASKKLGEDMYKFLKTYFQKNDKAKEALVDLKDNPNDPDIQATLRVQIKKLLTKDEEFAGKILSILERSPKAREMVNVSVHGDAKNFNVIGRNYGKIINNNS